MHHEAQEIRAHRDGDRDQRQAPARYAQDERGYDHRREQHAAVFRRGDITRLTVAVVVLNDERRHHERHPHAREEPDGREHQAGHEAPESVRGGQCWGRGRTIDGCAPVGPVI